MKGFDPYEQLGVPRDADARTVRDAYRQQAKIDVVSVVTGKVLDEMTEARNAISQGKMVVEFLLDVQRRFSLKQPNKNPSGDDDPIRRGIQLQVDRAQQQIAGLEHTLTVREMVLKILAGYKFEADVWPAWGSEGAFPCVRSDGSTLR